MKFGEKFLPQSGVGQEGRIRNECVKGIPDK
jgi:hypothetical protein